MKTSARFFYSPVCQPRMFSVSLLALAVLLFLATKAVAAEGNFDNLTANTASFQTVSLGSNLRVNQISTTDNPLYTLFDLQTGYLRANDGNSTSILDWSSFYNGDAFPGLFINVPTAANQGLTSSLILADTLGAGSLSVSGTVTLQGLISTGSSALVGVNENGELVRVQFSHFGYNSLGLGSTISPSYPLDVGGDASISGTLFGTIVSAPTIQSDVLRVGPPGTYYFNNQGYNAASYSTMLNLLSSSNSSTTTTVSTYSQSRGSVINSYRITSTSGTIQYLDLVTNGEGNDSGVIRFLTKSTSSVSLPVEQARFDGSGNLGLGTAAPASRLSVAGGVGIGGYAGSVVAPTNGLIVSGKIGAGTASPSSPLSVNGGAAIGTYAYGSAAPNNGLIVSGRVGIGTASPTTLSSNLLDVNGGATVRGKLRVRPGGDLGMGTFTSSSNLGSP